MAVLRAPSTHTHPSRPWLGTAGTTQFRRVELLSHLAPTLRTPWPASARVQLLRKLGEAEDFATEAVRPRDPPCFEGHQQCSGGGPRRETQPVDFHRASYR